MKYPAVHIDSNFCSVTGRRFLEMIRQSWPGPIQPHANIVLRWGQRTKFPLDKTIVIFDLGYFRRTKARGENRHYRLSINETHPTQLPPEDSKRWDMLDLQLESLFDPHGHILLVGRGGKTRLLTGNRQPKWEIKTLAKIRKMFPERRVIYRPKKMPKEKIKGAKTDGVSKIRDLCAGAALVYTQRSNVGHEGILYGIPVVSEGGPASDVCPREIQTPLSPLSLDARLDFLHRLAYWQWSVAEIRSGKIWPWLMKQIEARK